MARDSPRFFRFLDGVKQRGFRVRASTRIPPSSPAYIEPGNRTFFFNPESMTFLDMRHELKHFQQFKRAGSIRIGRGRAGAYEREAYRFEGRIGERQGFSREYLDYLGRMIEANESAGPIR